MTISWSPPGRECSTVHSMTAITSARRGEPVGPRWWLTPSQMAERPAPGEVGRQLALPVAEHVDRERAVARMAVSVALLEVEADQHERRLKRQRRDRVRGGPDRFAVGPDRRDHRDPGSEMPHRLAQGGRGDLPRIRVSELG